MVAVGLPVLGSILSISFLQDWRFEHVFGHALLEVLGAMLALYILLLFTIDRKISYLKSKETLCITMALVSMGLLDLFHAVMEPGNNFVWFHSLATLMGGSFFLVRGLVFLSQKT